MKIPQILWTTLCAVFLTTPYDIASACSVCFGDPNSKMTQSIGWGIWVLMGFIVGVLILFAALFLKIRARMKKLSAAH
jgi:hypothetical protein